MLVQVEGKNNIGRYSFYKGFDSVWTGLVANHKTNADTYDLYQKKLHWSRWSYIKLKLGCKISCNPLWMSNNIDQSLYLTLLLLGGLKKSSKNANELSKYDGDNSVFTGYYPKSIVCQKWRFTCKSWLNNLVNISRNSISCCFNWGKLILAQGYLGWARKGLITGWWEFVTWKFCSSGLF